MKDRLTMPQMLLLMAEVIAVAILAVVASSHFGLGGGARITVGYLGAYLVPRILLTRARGTSTTALVVLFLLALGLCYLNYSRLLIWTFFDEFSLQYPNLKGDARVLYKWALNVYQGVEPRDNVVFPGFPLFMVGLWKVLGLSAVWPQSMNLMFTLTSVVLTGMTTRRVLSHRVSVSQQTLVLGGMLLVCLLMFYMFMCTAMLKEASIALSVTMAGFALSSMVACDEERHHPWRDIVLFVLACILMGLVRTTYLYIILVGVIVLSLPHLRRDWMLALLMCGILIVSLVVGNYFSSYSFDRHAEIAGGGWNMQRFYVISESQRFYSEILDYYFLNPIWQKLLMLPLTVSVQFVIPFPWTYNENGTFLNQISRMTYGWYLLGGTSVFYYLYASWRRVGNMGAWAWWPALCYVAIAYVMAGSVARYVVPIQPLFVPVAMYVLCRLYERRWHRPFIIWMIVFIILLAIALLLCLEIQQGTISKMLHTQSLVNYWHGLEY